MAEKSHLVLLPQMLSSSQQVTTRRPSLFPASAAHLQTLMETSSQQVATRHLFLVPASAAHLQTLMQTSNLVLLPPMLSSSQQVRTRHLSLVQAQGTSTLALIQMHLLGVQPVQILLWLPENWRRACAKHHRQSQKQGLSSTAASVDAACLYLLAIPMQVV